MSTINPILSVPELIKIEVDQLHSVPVEWEKNINIMKMEMEMGILVRMRDSLKEEVDLLERTQSYTELEKCSVEEKLRRSERRCEALEERIVQMGEMIEKLNLKVKKCEEFKRKDIETNEGVKKMESDTLAELYKSRLDELEPRMLKIEVTLAKALNGNLANVEEVDAMDKSAAAAEEEENVNMPDSVENGKVKADAGDGDSISAEVCGNGGIGLSKKGGRNLAYSGTEEDGANVVFAYPRSKPAYISDVAESRGSIQDNKGKKLEVRGSSYRGFSCRCDLKIINVIKNNLQKENLEIFEQSCFGNLLKINPLKFQGQLMLQLLLHMDMSVSKNERLVFKINSSNMEFGPSEFFHITGLCFGNLETEIATYSPIHKDVFQGRPNITLKDIEEAFLNISSCHKGKGELTLKLAMLYFLYGTLLANRWTNKIDVQYLYLIEDMQKFNAFPWGRVAYQFLVLSILQARVRMDGSEITHQVPRPDIYGFCYALQAWAYEVMPCVAAHCASRAKNFENLTPWILRWSAKTFIRSDTLKKFLTLNDEAHLNNTMGKWEELSTPLSKAQQKKRKFLYDNNQMLHAQPSPAAVPTTPPPPPPSMNASTYLLRLLAPRLSRAESMLESIQRKFDQPILDISYDDVPRNESHWVEDEEVVKEAEQPTSATTNPISMNNKHANLEQATPLSELANHKALDTPQLLWKENSDQSEICEGEYERSKALYERFLDQTKCLNLWISYAKFEASSGIKEESDFSDKRKCLERARAVFERALSYFRSCAPELKEERAVVMEEWFDMESSFGEVGDVDLVLAKLPQKFKRRMHIQTDGDGSCRYEEHIEYLFPEAKQQRSTDRKILEAQIVYKRKKHRNAG